MEEWFLPHDHGISRNMELFQEKLGEIERFTMVSELFKQLGDPTRVRIFWLLSHCEQCVVNLSALLGMSSPAVSHHLKALRDCGLLVSRREGKEVYYQIADTQVCRMLHPMVEQVMEIACPQELMGSAATQTGLVRQVHDYLLEHLGERITIEQLSQRFLVNQTTLKESFKAVYGTSIAAHVKEHRMELAARLLCQSGESVAHIAKQVGYESQSRFGDAFKERHGMLPTEYRRLYRNG